MTTLEEARIKEEIAQLANKWIDKIVVKGTRDYLARTVDRIKYRHLQRQLKNPPEDDIVQQAKKIFEIKEGVDK